MNNELRQPDQIRTHFQVYSSLFAEDFFPRDIRPGDIDMRLHNAQGNRFQEYEFKPFGGQLTVGQFLNQRGFARLDPIRCRSFVVQQPEQNLSWYPDNWHVGFAEVMPDMDSITDLHYKVKLLGDVRALAHSLFD